MAENAHHNQTSPVYVGEAKAEQPKPDTEYHKKMQEIFDVVAPEVTAERQEAAEAQGAITVETAKLLQSKSTAWKRYNEHKNISRFFRELDVEWRGRELPHKLDRVMIFSVLGGASALMDWGADEVATRTFLKPENDQLFRFSKPPWDKLNISLHQDTGNREAIKAGWEMLTDTAIGLFSDKSVAEATNRNDVRFVSPLSDTLSKIGNVAAAFWVPKPEGRRLVHKVLNSLVNPSTIESIFRSLGSIPVAGAGVERLYKGLNALLTRKSTIIPFGFDLVATTLAAKAKFMK